MSLKAHLRRDLLKKRKDLSPSLQADRTKILHRHLIQSLKQILTDHSISQIFAYVATSGEVEILEVVAHMAQEYQLEIGLPVTQPHSKSMYFRRWAPGEALISGAFSILEPPQTNRRLHADSRTMVITPALGVTRDGFRLGYGKGFYDRYLAHVVCAKSVAVVFKEFVLENGFEDKSLDQKVDLVITD